MYLLLLIMFSLLMFELIYLSDLVKLNPRKAPLRSNHIPNQKINRVSDIDTNKNL